MEKKQIDKLMKKSLKKYDEFIKNIEKEGSLKLRNSFYVWEREEKKYLDTLLNLKNKK